MNSYLEELLQMSLPPDLQAQNVTVEASTFIVDVLSIATGSACPSCAQEATRVHSRYRRRLHDLSWGAVSVVLNVSARRFRCINPACERRIFTERFKTLAPPYATRTARCSELLNWVATAVGGRGGARLLGRMRLTGSASTLLRVMRNTETTTPNALRVVGVDDFALRKGQTYGTVVVDLERHRPVAILSGRTAEGLAAWLRNHPTIEVVTRDRSTEFARAINLSLPKATQVLDRWHLLKNLSDVVERFLGRHQRLLREVTVGPRSRSQAGEAVRSEIDARRETLLRNVRDLRHAGHSTRDIARRLGISRYLAKRYVVADAVPARRGYTRTRSILDPYLDYLERRWDEGCQVSEQLLREIKAQGFPGTRRMLDLWIRPRRQGLLTPTPEEQQAILQHQRFPLVAATEKALPLSISPQELMELIWKEPELRREAEQECLDLLVVKLPVITEIHALVRDFITLFREKCSENLNAWFVRARNCDVPEIQLFSKGLAREQPAVEAAICLPWSNGPVEGIINKIKLIKRQMYGRASLPTLRARVLRTFTPGHQT